MPPFLIALLARSWVKRSWSFLKGNWKLLLAVLAAVVLVVIVVRAIHAYHDSLSKAHDSGVQTERQAGQVRTAGAVVDVTKARAVLTQAIADVATDERKAQAPSRAASQQRQVRDAAAIASAPADPMVTPGGPLDRMFPGESK